MSSNRDFSRRQVLSTAALALAAPLFHVRWAMAADPVTVEIANGKLQGLREPDVVTFKGIPYGADTGGVNRFMAPRPVANWTGVREAVQFGDRSPQGTGQPPAAGARGSGAGGQAPSGSSENCLVLNVYTPDLNSNARRPVMFWIHGGGFRGGSGEVDGRNLAKLGGVVVVAVNHRLNLFGYSPLGHLNPDFADAGNAGQLDLIAALEWVKTNIRVFGGNPDSVTLFGQSGGGSKIQTLMFMPGGSGLFHRAINMSGTTFYGIDPIAQWDPLMNEWLKGLGIDKGNLRKLQNVPVEQLLAAHATAVAKLDSDDYRPVVDGRHIPYGPLESRALTMNPSVPLIVQNVDAEASGWLRREPLNATVTTEQVRTRIKAAYALDDAKAEAVMAGYRRDEQNRTPWDVLLQFSSDVLFRGRELLYAEALSKARRTPVYSSNVVYKPVVDGSTIWGTPHATDVGLAFGNVGAGPGIAAASRNLMATNVAFAKTGNPNNPNIPEWKPYEAMQRATMTFDAECRLVNDYRGGGRQASKDLLQTDAYAVLEGALFKYSAYEPQ
jgi:para-nitrobenzyl esterase